MMYKVEKNIAMKMRLRGTTNSHPRESRIFFLRFFAHKNSDVLFLKLN